MSCALRRFTCLHQAPARNVLRSFSSTSSVFQNAAPLAAPVETTKNLGPPQPSSCPPGTVMTGLNIMKNGKDPVALADDAYPDWLWSLLEPKKSEWSPEEQLSQKYLRTVTKDKIKANSLAKRTK
ncbi:mitochondrial ribosomal protein L37-domain-containing protein [Gaertneriomyces semiglobifer]|nr:mitochondrial ribosomal protein L37-domain-containing protein [Gaertneriomyces semiglobifer]